MNNNYNSNTVVKQDFAVVKQVDGRVAHMTDTTRHQSWQSNPLPDHAGSIPGCIYCHGMHPLNIGKGGARWGRGGGVISSNIFFQFGKAISCHHYHNNTPSLLCVATNDYRLGQRSYLNHIWVNEHTLHLYRQFIQHRNKAKNILSFKYSCYIKRLFNQIYEGAQ